MFNWNMFNFNRKVIDTEKNRHRKKVKMKEERTRK